MGTSIDIKTKAKPAGNPGEIQWNNNGEFGANPKLHWDNIENKLKIDTGIIINSVEGLITTNSVIEFGQDFMANDTIRFWQDKNNYSKAWGGLGFQNGSVQFGSGVGAHLGLYTGSGSGAGLELFDDWGGDQGSVYFWGGLVELGNSGDKFLIKNNDGYTRVAIGGNNSNPQARLDIRAQGALSTDIALRVRNSADTADIFKVSGDGFFTQLNYAKNKTKPPGDETILFDEPWVYSSAAAPITDNILDDLTNAKLGVVQKIYHESAVAPTLPAGWVNIGTTTYDTTKLNIIYAEFAEGTRVEYRIFN